MSLRAATDYVRENAAVIGHFAEWVSPGDVPSEDNIALGSGAIVRVGLTKHAVYKDSAGNIAACSAICPHLGCLVSWNSAEDSWDCPCHGSGFDPYGKVLRGPAKNDLQPMS